MTIVMGLPPWPSGLDRCSLALLVIRHLTAVGSSLALVTCETSKFCLRVDMCVFLGDLPFSPHLMIGSAQNELNNLGGP